MIKSQLLDIEYESSEIQNFRKLLLGRIELFLVERIPGLAFMDKHLTEEEKVQITYHPKPIHAPDYHLLVSKKVEHGKAIIDAFNKGLGEIDIEIYIRDKLKEQ